MTKPLSHIDADGRIQMVDVGAKPVSVRMARASGTVRMAAETLNIVRAGAAAKGNVLEVARLAGIMAAKRTADWIPLCHGLPLDSVDIDFRFTDAEHLAIEAATRASARTGVEMEALVAVSAAALTVYDMCKSVDRNLTIGDIRLEEKTGGRSGHYLRSQTPPAEGNLESR
jgi:cyclic pyranopterin monophosphate synthase